MGDMGDDFAAMSTAKQERHQEWKAQNMAVLNSSDLNFKAVNFEETVLIREPGKPKVDFFPSSGRWRVAGVARTFQGGAQSFLDWYRKQGDHQ